MARETPSHLLQCPRYLSPGWRCPWITLRALPPRCLPPCGAQEKKKGAAGGGRAEGSSRRAVKAA